MRWENAFLLRSANEHEISIYRYRDAGFFVFTVKGGSQVYPFCVDCLCEYNLQKKPSVTAWIGCDPCTDTPPAPAYIWRGKWIRHVSLIILFHSSGNESTPSTTDKTVAETNNYTHTANKQTQKWKNYTNILTRTFYCDHLRVPQVPVWQICIGSINVSMHR